MPRITCLQLRPRASFDGAIGEIRDTLAGIGETRPDLICLPEYCGGLRTEGALLRPPAVTEDSHPVLDELKHQARACGSWLLVGSIAVTEGDNLICNRSMLVDDHGTIVARYDKIHLFDIHLAENMRYEESAVVNPGNQAVIAQTPAGRLGMTVCYDLRFPKLYRDMAQAGAELLAVPAAFTRVTGEAHWHVLNRARAIENCAYVVSPCAVGAVPGGGECYGHSLVIDPWGRVLADGGDRPGMMTVDIDTGLVHETRQKLPSLDHDREYGLICHESQHQ